ncbi:uncharacterized protein LOC132302447 isoform X2 [Cornus florida]|uniref:uncharacterized protein LOC132302447 isoform X2 n=1 Tax=Cornus florida TaxID=4283 RepID=UPI002899BDF8|nr:uncharacterized protein LOC132302447 isoform X2 [Cornus florida]
MISNEYVPAELVTESKQQKRDYSGKKEVQWKLNPDSDLQKLDIFEKLEKKDQGQDEKGEKEKKEDEEEEDDERIEEGDEEFSDDGDYNQVVEGQVSRLRIRSWKTYPFLLFT